MTEPFITQQDEFVAQSKSPRDIGQMKLNGLNFLMEMSDAEIDVLCQRAKEIKATYWKWEQFYRDIELRKKRNMGFKAAVMALDLVQAAAAMETTPEKVAGVLTMYAAAEDARIKELEALWKVGQLPDRAVLGDPSKDIIEKDIPIPPVEEPVEEPVDSAPTA